MKLFFTSLLMIIASTTAFAHPGRNKLVCKSAANAGSTQNLQVELVRSNGVGYFPPAYSITVDGAKYSFTTKNEKKSYGETFHNSPLGVIRVTGSNFEETKAKTYGSFSVVAIPSTVQAFDYENKLVTWTFEAEKDECNDTNGKATFQGIFNGTVRPGDNDVQIDTQIMDCELTYDSGMSC